MKISYKNTMQDIIELNFYILNYSSFVKKILIMWICNLVFLIVVSAYALNLIYGRVSSNYKLSVLLIFTLSIILIPKIMKWNMSRKVINRVNEYKSKNIFRNTTLTLDDEGITKEDDLKNTRLSWKIIQKVIVKENQIFIFTNALHAIIVPLKAFDSIAEKNSFLEFVYKNVNK